MSRRQPPAAGGWTPPARLDLRVSDADRRTVADLLGEHFAEGRLDPAEHQDRVGQAMAAKTGADLVPLLTDLPVPGLVAAPAPPRRRRWSAVALVVVLLLAVGPALAAIRFHVGLLAVVVVVLLLAGRRRRRRACPPGRPGVGTGGGSLAA